MRKLFFLVAAFTAACGGSSGGGGGVSGTVGGKAFSPADVKAIVAGTGSSPCSISLGGTTVPVGIKAFGIQFTSYADACGDFSNGACKLHQNAQTVTVIFARLKPPSVQSPTPSEPALTPGTYTVTADVTTPQTESGGTFYVAFSDALATDATCGGTPALPSANGTLRVDEVSGPITGHVALTFAGGGSLNGDFSAPVCTGLSLDVCSLTSSGGQLCSGTPTCVP